MRRLFVVFALLSSFVAVIWPEGASAQVATPTPSTHVQALTIGGALVKKGTDRTPIVGLRATVDTALPFGLRGVARVDLLALSDGGAISEDLTNVPSFTSAEGYVALYRPVFGPVAIEVMGGRAHAVEETDAINKRPEIFGGGLRVAVGDGAVFVGLGRHAAAGDGVRVLVSALVPTKGRTYLVVDGAVSDRDRTTLRMGAGIRF